MQVSSLHADDRFVFCGYSYSQVTKCMVIAEVRISGNDTNS